MRGVIREPLVHFIILGAALFGLYALLGPDRPRPLELGDDVRAGLRADFVRRHARQPTAAEQQGAQARWLEDEALVREARRRGLDRGDPIVRRRLAQVMRFVLEQEIEIGEPTEAELRALFEAAVPATPVRFSFNHVYFSRQANGDPAAVAREALAGGEPAAGVGESFLHGAAFEARSSEQIAARFGEAFAEGVSDAPVGKWIGPLMSAYGAHLVWMTERLDPGPADFAAARPALIERWRADQRQEQAARAVAALAATESPAVAP